MCPIGPIGELGLACSALREPCHQPPRRHADTLTRRYADTPIRPHAPSVSLLAPLFFEYGPRVPAETSALISSSTIDYRAELNDQQYAAVTSGPGPALVLAGAGSGKTRTLTYRVAWLLDNGVEPQSILLLTFTNKAAREMLTRVQSLVPLETTAIWGGTFHSIGNRLLRKHALEIGFRPGYTIMDREDQEDLLSAVVAGEEVDTDSDPVPDRRGPGRYL